MSPTPAPPSLLCFFVRATLERALKFLGECNAVNGEMQSLVVLVLKPVGDIVEVVTVIDAAVGENAVGAHLAGNRRPRVRNTVDRGRRHVRISALRSQVAGYTDICKRSEERRVGKEC